MILALLIAAVVAAPPPAAKPAPTTAPQPKAAPVTDPVWLAGPSQTMMMNCTTGYLTDPAFTGESIWMGCTVQPNGTLGQCLVKETKRAQAAGVEDVAICAAAGFRMGPIDKQGKPTAGRPVLIPMGIATIDTTSPAQTQPPAPANQP